MKPDDVVLQYRTRVPVWRPVGRAAPLSWWWPWSDVLSSRLVDSAVVFYCETRFQRAAWQLYAPPLAQAGSTLVTV